jgi:hypothetical protein
MSPHVSSIKRGDSEGQKLSRIVIRSTHTHNSALAFFRFSGLLRVDRCCLFRWFRIRLATFLHLVSLHGLPLRRTVRCAMGSRIIITNKQRNPRPPLRRNPNRRPPPRPPPSIASLVVVSASFASECIDNLPTSDVSSCLLYTEGLFTTSKWIEDRHSQHTHNSALAFFRFSGLFRLRSFQSSSSDRKFRRLFAFVLQSEYSLPTF